MWRIILPLIISLNTFKVFSRHQIQGVVKDSAQVVMPGVNVFVKDSLNQKILVFGQTQKDGTFTLKFNSDEDSVWIHVTLMGYASQSIKIATKTSQKDFILQKGAFELDEIKVKKPPARRFGDTLSYEVSRFQTDADRTIGDVIKRLPGVDVDVNGRIFYQGVPINRYYIENLNPLDGRYGLVNENLAFDKVTSVEILENHQPIRVLDSLQRSDAAAINLKLKNKFTKTVPVRMALGLAPILWDISATPMVFVPNLQFIGSIQSNNAGRGMSNQFKTPRFITGINTSQLSVSGLSRPPLRGNTWLDNKTHGASLNVLRKIKNQTVLKLNSALLFDKEHQEGLYAQNYSVGGETISFTEEINNNFRKNQAEISLNIENNQPLRYFKNNLSFQKDWAIDDGLNYRSDRSYEQHNKTNGLGIINDFHRIIKRQRRLYNFYSQSSFDRSIQRLNVNLTGIDTLASPVQDYTRSAFKTHNYFNFSRKLGSYTNLGGTLGSEITSNHLESELTGHEIDSDTVNQLNWSAFKTYLRLSASIRKDSWSLGFYVPFAYYFIDFNDELYNTDFQTSQWVPEPGMFFVYDNKKLKYTMNFSYKENIPDAGMGIYPGYVMMNYMALTRRKPDFDKGHRLLGNAQLAYNDVVSGFNYRLGYNRSQTVRNRVSLTDIRPDGSDISSFLNMRNVVQNSGIEAKIGQYFYSLKSSGSLGISYNLSKNKRMLNDVLGDYSSRFVSANAGLNFNGISWLDLGYSFNFSHSANAFDTGQFSQYNHQGVLGLTASRWLFFRWSAQYYLIDRSNTRNDYLMGDFRVRFTLKKSKRDIELDVTNLFNQKEFKTLSVGDYYLSQSVYRLRPRQVMINFNFSF